MLTSSDIASMIDHSMLQPYLTDYEISSGCETAIKYHTASVCARPADMPTVVRRLEGTGIPACTVIGFPHGSAGSPQNCSICGSIPAQEAYCGLPLFGRGRRTNIFSRICL